MPKVEVATRSARPLPALEADVCSGGRNIQKKETGSGRPIWASVAVATVFLLTESASFKGALAWGPRHSE